METIKFTSSDHSWKLQGYIKQGDGRSEGFPRNKFKTTQGRGILWPFSQVKTQTARTILDPETLNPKPETLTEQTTLDPNTLNPTP